MEKIYEIFLTDILKNNLITQVQYINIEAALKEKKDFESILHKEAPNLQNDTIYDVLGELYKKQRITLNEIIENFALNLKDFLKSVATKFRFEYIDLDNIDIDYKLCEKVPLNQLKTYEALPIKEDEIAVYVAFKNPFDISGQDRLQAIFNRKLLKTAIVNNGSRRKC